VQPKTAQLTRVLQNITVEESLFFGRQKELRLFEKYFENEPNKNQLILFEGPAGAGKTAFVEEAIKQSGEQEVVFISTKNELNRVGAPFLALVNSFRKLVLNWKTDQELFRSITAELKSKLKSSIPFLTSIIPELFDAFDSNEDKRDVIKGQFEKRFHELFLVFLKVSSLQKKRIVFFIDDLQWADHGTISFLKTCLREKGLSHITWIGAFRESELTDSFFLQDQEKDRFSSELYIKSHINIRVFTLEMIKDYCSAMLRLEEQAQSILPELIYQLTGGNPFYINQSIRYFIEKQILQWSDEYEEWQYFENRLDLIAANRDVLSFILQKIEEFPEATIALIAKAAAIGRRFNFNSLNQIFDYSFDEIEHAIELNLKAGIIEKENDSDAYVFTHDIMQKAVYSFLDEESRELTHLKLGKCYLSSLSNAAADKNIFEIVYQFNQSNRYIGTGISFSELANLNVAAGKKALSTCSYHDAVFYFEYAISLIELDRETWTKRQVFDVYIETARAAYYKSDYVGAVMHYESALKYAQSDYEEALVYLGFVDMYNSVSDLESSWESGVKALKLLQIDIPRKTTKLHLTFKFIELYFMQKRRSIESIIEHKKNENPSVVLAQKVLKSLGMPAFFKGRESLGFNFLKCFELTLKHGLSPYSYYGIAGYGKVLGFGLGRIKVGRKYLTLSQEAADKSLAHQEVSGVDYSYYGTFPFLIEHISNSIEPLRKSYYEGSTSGDYNIAVYSALIIAENLFLLGTNLQDLKRETDEYVAFLNRTNNHDFLSSFYALYDALDYLVSGKDLKRSEKDIMANVKKEKETIIRYSWNIYKLQAAIVFRDEKLIIKTSNHLHGKRLRFLSPIELNRIIYVALSYRYLSSKNSKLKSNYELTKLLRKVKAKAKHAPQNFSHIVELIKAVRAEINGKDDRMISFYQAAINQANDNNYIQHAAVYNEILGRYFYRMKNGKVAETYLKSSLELYVEWGADAKVDELILEFYTK
jgi:histidine kinase